MVAVATGRKAGNDSDSEDGEGGGEDEGKGGEGKGKVRVRDLAYLSKPEQNLVIWFNMARGNPHKFADHIASLKETHLSADGKRWQAPPMVDPEEPELGEEFMPIQLVCEGSSDFDEALAYVRSQPELPRFQVEEGLCLACQDHVGDQWENGGTSSMGSDVSNFRERAARYGQLQGEQLYQIQVHGHQDSLAVALWVAWNNTSRKRSDRVALFHPDYTRIGVASGAHPEWGASTTILLAADYHTDPALVAARSAERRAAYLAAAQLGYQFNFKGRRVKKSSEGGNKGCCLLQ